MNKTLRTLLALMAGVIVFNSCSGKYEIEDISEQKTSALKPMTFIASMEGQSNITRTSISADGVSINWSAGDKISIFDGASENEGNQIFSLASGNGTTSASFTGTAAEGASVYYALYPKAASGESRVPTEEEAMAASGNDLGYLTIFYESYGEDYLILLMSNNRKISKENQAIILAYLKGEEILMKRGVQRNADDQFEGVVLPAQQTVGEGQYVDPNSMLMIAQSEDASTLNLKNVCAYVKVTPLFDCIEIKLTSKDTENLAGTVTVDYNEGTPTATVTADGFNAVSLSGTIKANYAYYIAVLPSTLSTGFNLTFNTSEGKYEKITTQTLALTRNNVTNLGSFTKTDCVKITGKAYASGPDCEVGWVQLWAGGPKFAEYNIGATSATDKGGYYTWGGTYTNGKNIQWKDDHNNGSVSLSSTSDPITDTATNLWGNNWRMPTREELQALINNCTCKWITNYNSIVSGLLCTGQEGTVYESYSVFFPAASYCNEDGYNDSPSSIGAYWSSEPEGDHDAYDLNFNSGVKGVSGPSRDFANSVRPVLNEVN